MWLSRQEWEALSVVNKLNERCNYGANYNFYCSMSIRGANPGDWVKTDWVVQ